MEEYKIVMQLDKCKAQLEDINTSYLQKMGLRMRMRMLRRRLRGV